MKRVLAVAALTSLAAVVRGGDLEDLKAAVERELGAWGARDCKTVVALRTDGSIVQMGNRPEIERFDRTAALKQCEEGTFERWNESKVKSVKLTPEYQYELIGTTGLVSGQLHGDATLEDGAQRKWTARRMETWVKEKEGWRRAALAATIPAASSAIADVTGTWELVSSVRPDGTAPPERKSFAIFTGQGQYAMMGTPPGRAKVEKKLEEMTLEELRARYTDVFAQLGTYTIADGKMTRRAVVALNPAIEGGSEMISHVRVEGGELHFKAQDPASKAESRYRRAR